MANHVRSNTFATFPVATKSMGKPRTSELTSDGTTVSGPLSATGSSVERGSQGRNHAKKVFLTLKSTYLLPLRQQFTIHVFSI